MASTKQLNPTDMEYQGVVYYRQRSILLLAHSLCIGPEDKTHKRQAIRLIIGCSGPVELAFNDGSQMAARALLIAPDADLCDIKGQQADVTLIDVTPVTPEYEALDSFLNGQLRKEINFELFEDLIPAFVTGQDGSLTCDDVVALMQRAVLQVTGTQLTPLEYDHRIITALNMIEELPLVEICLDVLSKAVNLSPDRFRHLFKETTGCTVSQYARQTAVWRALNLIAQNSTITAASHAVGFHDVSHFYRVYSDMFGISLSEKSNPRKFRRVRCFN